MRKYWILVFYSFLIFSCSDRDDNLNCDTNDPIKDLAWLKAEIEQRETNSFLYEEYFYISQAYYNSQNVFLYLNCCPFCNTSIPVYDCEGNSLGFIGDDILSIDITNSFIIYEPSDFACKQE